MQSQFRIFALLSKDRKALQYGRMRNIIITTISDLKAFRILNEEFNLS